MGNPIRVLHVDDDPDWTALASELLERADERLTVAAEDSASAGLERLGDEWFDCVVSDYDMPGRNGVEFLEAVRDEFPDLPFILFTGKGSEEVASDAISAGVSDYLQKRGGTDQFAVLANRINNLVRRARAERNLERRLEQQEVIADLGRRALGESDLGPFFDEAVGGIARGLDTEFTKLLRCRDDHGLDLVAGVGWRDGLVGEAVVEGGRDSQAGYTLKTEEPVIVEDLESEERFSGPALLLEHGVVSGLSVIVGTPDDPWGVVGTHTSEARQFTEYDVNFVQGVANILASAIEHTKREARFREVAENIQEVVWVSDSTKEELLYVNPAYEAVWGRSVESLYESPRSFIETIHPDDRERIERRLPTQAAGEFEAQYRIVRPDGEVRWIRDSAVPIRDDDGSVDRIVGIATDITDIEEARRRLDTLVSNLPGIVYRCANEPTWPMEYVKGDCEELTGYPADELESDEVLWGEDILHPDDRRPMWDAVQETVEDGGKFEVTYRIVTRDGTTKWVWERGRGVYADDGELDALEGFITEITDQKEREAELARQNERLAEFANIVSHDLRNPLQVARTSVELAREEHADEHLDSTERALDRMLSLIEDLLALARDGQGAIEEASVPFADLVDECWGTVESGETTLRNEASGTVQADRRRLQQLLENLLTNAAEHGGGEVTVGLLPDGFYVEDDGAGIPPAERPEVFELGNSGDPDGTGFGLAIVERVAEAHDWELDVTDGEAGGARFEVTGVTFADA